MPDNMEQDLFDLAYISDQDLSQREERCQKAMRAVAKAIFMRLVVCVLLIGVVLKTALELWVIGLILLVLLMNAAGMLPLVAEWKKRRTEWKNLLEEEEG